MNEEEKDKFKTDLQESEDRYRFVTETSVDAIITADENDSVLTWNKGAIKIFGYSLEIIGRAVTTIIPEKYKQAHLDGVSRFLETGEKHIIGKTVELEAVRKDGTLFPIELSLSTWDSLTGVNFGAIIRDISERKSIERVREDVQRIMRHDIRSPLVGITGLSKVLQKDSNLTEKQKKAAELIQELGEKTLKFINRTRDLYQMEQGVYRLKPETTDLATIIENVKQELGQMFDKKGNRLNLYIHGERAQENYEYPVQGDEGFLEMMLGNLIKNAVDASPAGAYISLSIDKKERDGRMYHVIDIHNSGAIPRDIRDKFFDPYSTSGKKGGTGLGTYSALLVVKAHQGNIRFTTSETEGTDIIIELPMEIKTDNAVPEGKDMGSLDQTGFKRNP